jgi:DNA mismatch endonuclease (patch repair protein)
VADKLTPERRSENMRRIKSKGMKPELLVRSLVHNMGYRFRLHRKDLPGKPDLVFGPKRKAIYVHGCFWHNHEDPACPYQRTPKSNLEYWLPKLSRNRQRDKEHLLNLNAAGWESLVIWECEVRQPETVKKKIRAFLKAPVRE